MVCSREKYKQTVQFFRIYKTLILWRWYQHAIILVSIFFFFLKKEWNFYLDTINERTRQILKQEKYHAFYYL